MCIICDGATYQRVFDDQHARISTGDWALQGVEPGPNTVPWVYTIGLIENFEQAEFVITHIDLDAGAWLLNELGDRVAQGLRIDARSSLEVDGLSIEFEAVHPTYLAHGLCASWNRYYDALGAEPGPLRALQVVPPRSDCDHCNRLRRCLVTPGCRDFGAGPNRAARRARERERERRRKR